ncbi:hypothetical protein KQJ29_33795, partial [Enterococcus sp. S181_ASV_20]|nr:hypothetical protein [Enterococcus sp. S181_ASV_20]
GLVCSEMCIRDSPFGGRYRIIDFTLSNCINSGINNVGVVTQYQPLALNNHIGNGSSWGFDGLNSGVTILQPYSCLLYTS